MDAVTATVVAEVQSNQAVVSVELLPGAYVGGLIVSDGELESTNDPLVEFEIATLDLTSINPVHVTLNGVAGDWGEMVDVDTLMVKFDNAEICATVAPEMENEMVTAGAISGSDTIMVIDRGSKGNKGGKKK
jgi:hypothetical protein